MYSSPEAHYHFSCSSTFNCESCDVVMSGVALCGGSADCPIRRPDPHHDRIRARRSSSLVNQYIVAQATELGISGCGVAGIAADTCPIRLDAIAFPQVE